MSGLLFCVECIPRGHPWWQLSTRSYRSCVGRWMIILSSVSFGRMDCMCTCVGVSVVYRCIHILTCWYDLLCGMCIHGCMDIYMWTYMVQVRIHLCAYAWRPEVSIKCLPQLLSDIYLLFIDWFILFVSVHLIFLFKTGSLTEPGWC